MDSSTSSVELDASFQRNLERKKMVNNKENSRPTNTSSTATVSRAGLSDRSGMPLGEIALDASTEPLRNIPNWILEESCVYTAKDSLSFSADRSYANKSEYSEINRLLANCDINIVESSTNNIDGYQTNIENDSLEMVNKTSDARPDDTLEEIEYVNYGDGLHYVPVKHTKRTIEKEEDNDFNKTQNCALSISNEIILIDSSPENSFTTAKDNIDTKSMIVTDESFVTTNNMTAARLPDNSDRTISSTKSTATEFHTMVDYSSVSTKESTLQINKLTNIDDNASSCLNETFDEVPEFDSTLERIEYLMEKGQQLQAKSASTAQTVITPKSFNKIDSSKGKSTPGKVQGPIQSTTNASPFKRPEHRPSPRQQQQQLSAGKAASKIPTLRTGPSSASKLQFRHIASPVATYIKKTAEVPLIKTVRHINKGFDPNIYGKAVSGVEHDVTVQSNKASGSSETGTKLSLPRKVFKAASHHQVYIEFHKIKYLSAIPI